MLPPSHVFQKPRLFKENTLYIFHKSFKILNSSSGEGPILSSQGNDTNIDLKLLPKGSGQVVIDGNVGIESGLIDLKNGRLTFSAIEGCR